MECLYDLELAVFRKTTPAGKIVFQAVLLYEISGLARIFHSQIISDGQTIFKHISVSRSIFKATRSISATLPPYPRLVS